jgi:hypothetical protein
MIETLTVITITVLLLIFFRPGKTEPLASPLVINRPGQFHAVLAPMLNLAQPMLEDISRHLGAQDRQTGNTETRYFKVIDKEVKYHGKNYYLLAITLRDGELYFQATAPQENSNEFDTIGEFSEAMLSRHPSDSAHSDAAETALGNAIETATSKRGSVLTPLIP